VGDLIELVELLGPGVLLLDDVPLHGGRGESNRRGLDAGEEWLDLLETIHGICPLVALTFMEDPGEFYRRSASDNAGSNSFAGIRPGRVDEVIRLEVPPEKIREAILRLAMGLEWKAIPARTAKSILRATQGLTGAYLMELGDRLCRHGLKGWKKEVTSLIMQSPHLGRGERGALRIARKRGLTPTRPTAEAMVPETIQALGVSGTPATEEVIRAMLTITFRSYGHKNGDLKTKLLLEKLVLTGKIARATSTVDGREVQVYEVVA